MSSFKKFKEAVQKQADKLTKQPVLFVVDITKEALWETYLGAFPEGTNNLYKERTEYDCNSCRHWIRDFGAVVSLANDEIHTVWDLKDLEYPFNVIADKLSQVIKASPVVEVFKTEFAKLGVDKNRVQDEDGFIQVWEHFYCEVPKEHIVTRGKSVQAEQAVYRDVKNVFKRSLEELTLDAGLTTLELIEQNSLYRGEEFKKSIQEFIKTKKKYELVDQDKRDAWCWNNSFKSPIGKIRNTALGTLLIDLSKGEELDTALRSWEKVMAPTNYKRPKPVVTQKQVEEAEKKLIELGLVEALERRFATVDDITVNNVLYINRSTKSRMGLSVFDQLKRDTQTVPRTLGKEEEISVEDFFNNVIKHSNNIELQVENRHSGNFMSLIAPVNKNAGNLFKWDNNFSWAYNGDITDSMKERVKSAGGKVDGVLRFSIEWNSNNDNKNDFDAHCREPKGNHIYFGSKTNADTTGMLDVDITSPSKEPAVENITWSNINKMEEGQYRFWVKNYHHKDGQTGFTAEIEYGGEIYSFNYNNELRHGEEVEVAVLNFTKKDGITFISSLKSTVQSQDIWGVKTNHFTPVKMCMYSPNHWDDQVTTGNRHYFFILEDCINQNQPRGFFNEFLKESLNNERKVFEALGGRMRVEPSEQQLSGVGFGSTQRNDIVAKVEGNFSRLLRIRF